MLVLSRNVGQEIVIGNQVRIRITAIQGKRVRLAIDAPADVGVRRQEVSDTNVASHPHGERVN